MERHGGQLSAIPETTDWSASTERTRVERSAQQVVKPIHCGSDPLQIAAGFSAVATDPLPRHVGTRGTRSAHEACRKFSVGAGAHRSLNSFLRARSQEGPDLPMPLFIAEAAGDGETQGLIINSDMIDLGVGARRHVQLFTLGTSAPAACQHGQTYDHPRQ